MADPKSPSGERRVVPLRRKRCPICGQTAVDTYKPFCSKACADRDLDRWLTGTYRIRTDDEEEEDGSPEES
jgi:endogenous inhibitor of DNA gyrase (YacG/DUF329 family)